MNLSKDSSPLFITGTWRSGTTLISTLLNNHHDVEVTYDTIHFMRFCYEKYSPLNRESVNQLLLDLDKRLGDRYQMKIEIENVLKKIDGDLTYGNIYHAIMSEFLLRETNKKIWGEKTNVAWRSIPDFFEMFPNARIIHVIRDPRAVLLSWKKYTNAPENDYLDSIINSYDSMDKAIHYQNVYSDKRYICVKYEDLVIDSVEFMKNIAAKLEIEFTPMMTDLTAARDFKGEKWESNSSHDVSDKGIYRTVMDKWKRDLQEWEQHLCQKLLYKYLQEFDYELIHFNSDDELVETSIQHCKSSALISDGLIRLLLSNKGSERYPTSPLQSKNWAKN